jgi:hypothetical protein
MGGGGLSTSCFRLFPYEFFYMIHLLLQRRDDEHAN